MKINRLSVIILATLLCLSGAGQQTRAQQPAPRSSKVEGSAGASLERNPANLLARLWRGRRSGFSLMPSTRYAGASSPLGPPAAASSAVHGDGTVGKISMWVGTHPSGSSTLGDSIITQLNDNIGIGLATPMSKLGVQGMIETTLGGYKFPDGTVQTTAAVSGLQSVSHDSTLTGDGTAGSPLGVAVPLRLSGATTSPSDSLLSIEIIGRNRGIGISSRGGQSDGSVGGTGVHAVGGFSDNFVGGIGVSALGGGSDSGNGGPAVSAHGGRTSSGTPGSGVRATGGNNQNGSGGIGLEAMGGLSENHEFTPGIVGGIGIRASGAESLRGIGGIGLEVMGGSSGFGTGGRAVVAIGGDGEISGGHGLLATGGNPNGRGVVATGGVGSVGYGVEATGGASTGSGSTAGAGLFAKGGPSSGSNSQSGFGIIATAGDATGGATRGRAAAFEGDVTITDLTVFGNLDVQGTKNFKIDHPLDPENKYLLHASVESSEVLNVYSGNIVTDAKGEGIVALPDWFEALNRDLRYQLTVIGTFAQAIVLSEVQNNRFTIKTTAPNVKVSWQVAGVRSDRAMQKQPFKAEENKPERERGQYLQPKLYNQPEERSVEWARNPEMMQKLKQQRIEARQIEGQPRQIGRLVP